MESRRRKGRRRLCDVMMGMVAITVVEVLLYLPPPFRLL